MAANRYVDDSDPDIIYQGSKPSSAKKTDDVITIGVHDLILNDKCRVFEDDDCEKVFVSVEFLDYPAEDLETPLSLAKGEPNKKYSFNFQKEYPIRDPGKKQQLAELVGPQSSGDIKFIVVGEPPEDQELLNCTDIGYATVNAKRLLRDDADCIKRQIDVLGMENGNKVVGYMTVTVGIVEALKKVQNHG